MVTRHATDLAKYDKCTENNINLSDGRKVLVIVSSPQHEECLDCKAATPHVINAHSLRRFDKIDSGYHSLLYFSLTKEIMTDVHVGRAKIRSANTNLNKINHTFSYRSNSSQ